MQVEKITEHSIITPRGEEIVLFLIQPTNVSVLSRESLKARVNALMNVLKGFMEVELLCLNSRESFKHNKWYLAGRIEQEEIKKSYTHKVYGGRILRSIRPFVVLQ